MSGSMILHAGAELCTREQIAQIETPAATESWQPIPHGSLIEIVQTQITGLGYKIAAESWGKMKDGARIFGTMDLVNGDNPADYRIVVGLRNTHDRSFAAGLAMGSRVFVCDNLAFSGEITIARRHTRFIMRDLPGLAQRAVGMLGDLRRTQDQRIAAYKLAELADAQAHDLLIRALDARILPNQRLPEVLDQWRQPNHDEFKPRTCWSLFNAFTEVLKQSNRFDLPRRTTALHGLMDLAAGIRQLPPAEMIAEGAEDTEAAINPN